jgi:glutathione S-transferase
LALGELHIEVGLVEERPWEWRPAFLALNPSGDLPVLEIQGGPIIAGAYAISEFIGEEVERHPVDGQGVPLFPGSPEERAEARRVVDWFHRKLDREVTRDLLQEKVYPQLAGRSAHVPDPRLMRAVVANLRYHLSYVAYLADTRRWLAGDEMSFADLAAAAHLSVADYLGEVRWDEHPAARIWYARMKSRRAMRQLLAERVPGLPPPLHYSDPDF